MNASAPVWKVVLENSSKPLKWVAVRDPALAGEQDAGHVSLLLGVVVAVASKRRRGLSADELVARRASAMP